MSILKRLLYEIILLKDQRDFIIKKWFYYNLLYGLLGTTKEVKINIKFDDKVFTFYLPNSPSAFSTVESIFFKEEYKKLKNLNCVLDLGAFLGESSIYFSIFNKEVVAIEADPKNFHFITKNIKNFPNIKAYNKAICTESGKMLEFYKDNENDLGTNSKNLFNKSKFKFLVETLSIKDLIKEYKPDGLKMDIEGGEFNIIRFFLKNPKYFNFIKGYIEFHITNLADYNNFKEFLNFLKEKNYSFKFEKNDFNNLCHLKNLINNHPKIFHLYFEKEDLKC